MYIYNVTISIDKNIQDSWLKWIKDHIPQVLATGRFSEAKLTKVLVDEEMGNITYSVQYKAQSRKDLDDYYKFDAERLRKDGLSKFTDKMMAFRTELEIIDEFKATVK